MPIREEQLERSMRAAAPHVSTVGVLDRVADKRARRRTARRIEVGALAAALVVVLSTAVVLVRDDDQATRVAAPGRARHHRRRCGHAEGRRGARAGPDRARPGSGLRARAVGGLRFHPVARGVRPPRRLVQLPAVAHRATRQSDLPRAGQDRSPRRDPLDRRRRRRPLARHPQPRASERAPRRVPEAHRRRRRGRLEAAPVRERPGGRRGRRCGPGLDTGARRRAPIRRGDDTVRVQDSAPGGRPAGRRDRERQCRGQRRQPGTGHSKEPTSRYRSSSTAAAAR